MALYAAMALAIGDPAQLGLFAVAYSLYQVALLAARAFVADPMLLGASISSHARFRHEGQVVLLGGAVSLLALMLYRIQGWHIRPGVALLLVGIPFLLAQDLQRYKRFFEGSFRVVAVADLAWLAATLPSLAFYAIDLSVEYVIALWLIGAGSSLLILVALESESARRSWPARTDSTRQVSMKWSLAVDSFFTNVPVALLLPISASIVSTEAAAWLRLLQIAFGPLAIAFQGYYVANIADTLTLVRSDPGIIRRRLRSAYLVAAVAGITLGLFLSILLRFLSETLVSSGPTPLIDVTVYTVFGVSGLGAALSTMILHALGLYWTIAMARVIWGACTTLGAIVGASIGGTMGLLLGIALPGLALLAYFNRRAIDTLIVSLTADGRC